MNTAAIDRSALMHNYADPPVTFVRGDVRDRGRLAAVLREEGVEADVIDLNGTIQLREHNCPYSKTVGEHPEVCSIIHTVLRETVTAS